MTDKQFTLERPNWFRLGIANRNDARPERPLRRLVALAFAAVIVASIFASTIAYSKGGALTGLFDEKRGVLTVAPVVKRSSPAVVNISVTSRVPGSENPLYRDPFFRRFFGIPEQLPQRESLSAGSGVIVDAAKGYILTNHHVVQNGKKIVVKLSDGRKYQAKLIGSDAATDIALISIPAKRLAALRFGSSKGLEVGDFVIAIGNPFGLGQTVTSGIVSALGRSGISRDKFENFIQTDAPINPGNSGGALINSKGELVGINTAIIAPGGGNVGIGFAVPADMAKAVMGQLIRHGKVKRGRIGVAIQDITPDIASALKLPVQRGALVSQVYKGSSAERAGIKPGDAIIRVDDIPILSGNELRNIIGLKEIGKTLRVAIVRKGREMVVRIRVGEAQIASIDTRNAVPRLAGAKITNIPDGHPKKGDVKGVYVAELSPGSSASRLGLRQGDIILAINQKPVESLQEFERRTKAARDVLALNILRDDVQIFIVVQ